MEPLLERCAGLDIHKKTVVACRMTRIAGQDEQAGTRTFGTTTRDLMQLADWLQVAGITHSHGKYWGLLETSV